MKQLKDNGIKELIRLIKRDSNYITKISLYQRIGFSIQVSSMSSETFYGSLVAKIIKFNYTFISMDYKLTFPSTTNAYGSNFNLSIPNNFSNCITKDSYNVYTIMPYYILGDTLLTGFTKNYNDLKDPVLHNDRIQFPVPSINNRISIYNYKILALYKSDTSYYDYYKPYINNVI